MKKGEDGCKCVSSYVCVRCRKKMARSRDGHDDEKILLSELDHSDCRPINLSSLGFSNRDIGVFRG